MDTLWLVLVLALVTGRAQGSFMEQPLARISVHRALIELEDTASISASPDLLGAKGETAEYVTVKFRRAANAENTDWIGVFSPANFNASTCTEPDGVPSKDQFPKLCSAPVKYKYANFSSPNYVRSGEGSLSFRLINMRADYSFGLFKGDVSNPVLLAVSNTVSFTSPRAPSFMRLANGFEWNEITVTWTSDYGQDEAMPLVKWGLLDDKERTLTAAMTVTFSRDDMCGAPATTVGWRSPGYIHTGHLKELWPNKKYFYQVAHKLENGSYVWGRSSVFKSPPFPGQDSLQRVVIFGDMGKAERDGSNEYSMYQPGCLNTTDTLASDIDNYDIIILNGDMAYANGYASQWDQFLEQVEPLSSRVPFMVTSGNHERDWPFSGSFYGSSDSGGECGVPAQTLFNMPAVNRAKYWYQTDWGLFRFCIANTEEDWREGTEQWAFLEECFSSVNRQKQPWLIFIAHRVLGYSSGDFYAAEGSFSEPMGRDLQKLWQKYRVDLAFYGHVHNYERTCPIYENVCLSQEKHHYSGQFNATIHIVAGGGGAGLALFAPFNTSWSFVKDYDFGFTKLTSFNRSSLLLEYKRSSDGLVYDKFWITRHYKDVLGCDRRTTFCPLITLAT
ncbi:acid phosphatase type 7 [Marchantia polymorpha subsp. ruderalis]|nr:hypothetical protein MARPO_0002s0096 [Marchantia polymorpha]PTQ49602.1 hypothetical protein MARPO_0002s0096 [Marchantia polymorpha]BBN00281.1 hypothetical protein Mp_1g27820 [Marchantia polymorpha subsp. ruderalis]BBN00282.1 hypothetical protein Mp_1g27820 [Marchantia polymorpha subsp. ruderalis]|eukprot:PTQ49601.1 hypothetical protein MARPO_0002s0096 [Marchantia polymorpha]